MIRTYTELIKIPTFRERFEYLNLNGVVGEDTFGFERYLNQVFYKSAAWRSARNFVMLRDNGCDLGVDGFTIFGKILIHHMNPITKDDIVNRDEKIFDPEYLITTNIQTHNAIHYGTYSVLSEEPIERCCGDTCLWRRK